MPQRQGIDHVKEIVPAVKALWQGDYEHNGALWQFPRATSVPKPVQQPHPPIWIAARDPGTFEVALELGANVMATPLSRSHAEVGILGERFRAALNKFSGARRPRFLMLRRTCVYRRPEDWRIPVEASLNHSRRFETLFRNIGGVENVPSNYSSLRLCPISAK
jgi:alkanesulfonate monooxygenase SsuD/methylene tetrahydromethanopterin reductase-like flavin-dependent oxidoreductase (luciferase family)